MGTYVSAQGAVRKRQELSAEVQERIIVMGRSQESTSENIRRCV